MNALPQKSGHHTLEPLHPAWLCSRIYSASNYGKIYGGTKICFVVAILLIFAAVNQSFAYIVRCWPLSIDWSPELCTFWPKFSICKTLMAIGKMCKSDFQLISFNTTYHIILNSSAMIFTFWFIHCLICSVWDHRTFLHTIRLPRPIRLSASKLRNGVNPTLNTLTNGALNLPEKSTASFVVPVFTFRDKFALKNRNGMLYWFYQNRLINLQLLRINEILTCKNWKITFHIKIVFSLFQ